MLAAPGDLAWLPYGCRRGMADLFARRRRQDGTLRDEHYGVNPMNESERDMAVADLIGHLRRLSPLERDFLDRWRTALGTTSGTSQLVRVFDRVKILASVEARAQRDGDTAILAAIERLEFACQPPNVVGHWGTDVLAQQEAPSPPVEEPDDHGADG
jgi:hypothetical protein